LGVRNVYVIDPAQDLDKFEKLIQTCLDTPELSVVIARRNCLLAAHSIREYERYDEQQTN
jgi:indolepyruvate ferredoxin oxidoreductase alpha subunit